MPPSTASPVSSAAARGEDKEVSPPVSVSRQDPLEAPEPEPEPMLSRKSTKASSSTSSVSAQSVASPAASSATSSSVGFDRDLFGKLEDVTAELDRLTRISTALPETRELEVVQAQLKRAQRHSSAMVQSQRELLDKIDRHERSSFRRYFQFNREHKVESLKETLWKRMNESATVERELEQLERKSDTLLEARRHTIADSDLSSSRLGFGSSRLGFGSSRLGFSSSRGFASSRSLGSSRGFDMSVGPPPSPSAALSEAAQVALRIDELERERQSIVGTLLQTLPVPETQQLGTRIAMYVSEIRASESIQQQVERCAAMYRDALRNLQNALAILLAPTYAGTLKEFVTGPYLMAVEASHQMEAASHVLQPEAQRRYRSYAPDLINVRPPKFPQAITDFAKRARVNYDRKSSLSVEGTRKLHAAENIIVLLHRIVIQKLELINQWLSEVEQDVARATEAHRRADARLREQMAVVARSASA